VIETRLSDAASTGVDRSTPRSQTTNASKPVGQDQGYGQVKSRRRRALLSGSSP
jgi:hypothetical protein